MTERPALRCARLARMSLSLPADPVGARSLTAVLTQAVASLSGRADWFAPASGAIVFVVDGLGSHNLRSRAGHARFLTEASSRADVARSVFPATTATALTSLLTGVDAGVHGIAGYRIRVPGTDDIVNQLRGWETDGLDPYTWQRVPPILEREALAGRPCFVVTKPEYAGSGLTEAILRGGEFVPAEDLADRVTAAVDAVTRYPGALVYLYAPELDAAGHKHGWESDAWSSALEQVDAAARGLASALPSGVGALVTADHGMVDIPRHRHILLTAGDDLTPGVRHIGGEPRMLHLYAEDGAAAAVADAWTRSESTRSWVMTRDDAIGAGLFGAVVDGPVRDRIGDVLVAARADVVYYDDRLSDKGPQRMVGQHGSLTPQERIVPLVRLGAFA